MLSPSLFIVMRLIHVVVGIVWGGAIVFIAAFLLPAFRGVGPASGPVMGYLVEKKKMPMYLMAGVLLTVLSGLALYWSDSAGSPTWMKSAPARTFGAGGVLAIIVAIMGMTINAPTAKKLGAIAEAVRGAGGPPSAAQAAEMQRLQGRLAGAMKVAAVLVIAAAALMAVARYMPT